MSIKKLPVLFDPHPKQMEFIKAVLSNKYSFVLFGGAIRGGKTFALLGLFILLCRLYPGSRWAIIRKTLTRIKLNVLPIFRQICPDGFIKKYPSVGNEWTFTATNGSEIIFFAENYEQDKDLERFKGLEVDGIGFDELDVVEESFNKAFERKGTWKMKQRKEAKEQGISTPPDIVVATCNPSQGWVKKRIYDKYKANKLNPKWLYIPSKVYDNPHITKEWIEDKKENMTKLNFMRFVDGDWEVNLNTHPFFYEYNSEKHEAEKLVLDELEPVWISFDFNINPTTAIIAQKISGKGLFILRTIQVEGGTEKLCDHLEVYKNYMLKITGDCSGNSGSSAAGLSGGQYVTDFKIIQEKLEISKHQMINTQGRNKLHTYSRTLCNNVLFRLPLKIDSGECSELIKDLVTGQPKSNGSLLKDRANHKQDAGDAFRYLINAWFPRGIEDIQKFKNLII